MGPRACPIPNPAMSIPLKRLLDYSTSQSGKISLDAFIISGMLGMQIKPIKKPEKASPQHIVTKFRSSKIGPIRRVDKPIRIRAVIIVTRYSTHFGMINGVTIVPRQ